MKLHSKELHDFCLSPNIIVVIKLMKMRWAERAALWGLGEDRNA
jgi:hypothetical protein